MKELLNTAIQRRKPLISSGTSAFRLFDGEGDGVVDVTIDCYDGHWVVGRKRDEFPGWLEGAPARSLWFKHLTQDGRGAPRLVAGDPPDGAFQVTENGVRFEIDLSAGYSQGLFLDQRLNRKRVAELVRERSGGARPARVLNTFAYTCGFSAVAAEAGASTTSVDLSGNYLAWGKRNFAANGLDPAGHYFVRGDVFEWLQQFAKKGREFDGVVLDPPTFSRVPGRRRSRGVFRVESDYARLVELAARLLGRGGWMLCCTNSRGVGRRRFAAMVGDGLAAAGRPGSRLEHAAMPPEFCGEQYLKSVWVET